MTKFNIEWITPEASGPPFSEALAICLQNTQGPAFDLEDLAATLGDGSDVMSLQVSSNDAGGAVGAVRGALSVAPPPILGVVGLIQVESSRHGFYEIRRLAEVMRELAGEHAHLVVAFRISTDPRPEPDISLWVRFPLASRAAVQEWRSTLTEGRDLW